MRSSTCAFVLLTITVGVFTVPAAVGGQAGYDTPQTFHATTLLGASAVKGPHYQIADSVRTDTFFHEFTLTTDYGPFEAVGRSVLAVRLQEIAALAALEDVSKTDVFLAAAGNSVVKIGQGAAAVVTNPEGTLKGVGSGIKRFGVNLGRRTERAVEGTGGESADGSNAAAGAANSVLARQCGDAPMGAEGRRRSLYDEPGPAQGTG